MIWSIFSGINLVELVIVFISVFLSSFGVPGGLVLLVSSGAFANNVFELLVIIVVGALAAVSGDIVAYELARRFSLYLSRWFSGFRAIRRGELRVKDFLERSWFSLIFFTRFALTALCAAVSYVSGFERLDRKKFYFAVIFGETLYASIYPLIGFIFRETWIDLANVVGDVISLLVIIVLIILISRVVASDLKWKRK